MKQKLSSSALFTLAVEGLFLAGFFLLVVFGAGTYRQAVDSQEGNGRTRALLSYFSTHAKASDIQDGVRLYEEDGRQVLSFQDPDSTYALRVYQHQGRLLEDYGELGSPLRPESATVIAETEAFHVEAQGPLYTVTTDGGEAVFCLKVGTGYAR